MKFFEFLGHLLDLAGLASWFSGDAERTIKALALLAALGFAVYVPLLYLLNDSKFSVKGRKKARREAYRNIVGRDPGNNAQ